MSPERQRFSEEALHSLFLDRNLRGMNVVEHMVYPDTLAMMKNRIETEAMA